MNKSYDRKSSVKFIFVILFIFAVCVFLSVFGFYSYFSYHDIQSSDLTPIEGTLQSTNLLKSGKRNTYLIKIEGYSCSFEIDDRSFSQAEWNQFESNAPKNENVTFSIKKSDADKLQSSSVIDIYDLCSHDTNYNSLQSSNDALRKNADIALIIGCAGSVLTAFLVVIFIRLRKWAANFS